MKGEGFQAVAFLMVAMIFLMLALGFKVSWTESIVNSDSSGTDMVDRVVSDADAICRSSDRRVAEVYIDLGEDDTLEIDGDKIIYFKDGSETASNPVPDTCNDFADREVTSPGAYKLKEYDNDGNPSNGGYVELER